MKEMVFNGSFPGLLTVLSLALNEKEEVRIWSESQYKPSLFGSLVVVDNRQDIAFDFKKKLACYFSEPLYRPVLYTFLSENENSGNLILDFLIKVLKNEDVFQHPVRDLEKGVLREKVRMLGLVRFKKVNQGYYYASINPKYNVIGLLGPHFSCRQGKKDWIIHDQERGLALIGKERKWKLFSLPEIGLSFTPEEGNLQLLWQEHFKALPVPGRINKKRQKSLIPSRYWPHLVETKS